jgi:hypothetical protein
VFEALGALISAASKTVKQALVNVVVVFVGVASFYVVLNVIQQGFDIKEGISESFTSTAAHKAKVAQQHTLDIQIALQAIATSDAVINKILKEILDDDSHAARVRLATFHDGVFGASGVENIYYDVSNVVAAPGRGGGVTPPNTPLPRYSELLPALLRRECKMIITSQLVNQALRDGNYAAEFLTCPVINTRDLVVGIIFVSWDAADVPLTGEALERFTKDTQAAALRIGVALDIRLPLAK